MFMFSFAILDTDLIMAVGPLTSIPWSGEIPSDNGFQARRPEADAPVICPKGVLFEIDKVPWLNTE
ncbi:Uncharacterised protein [Chlamydia trachomatis]|nr:Uncharacterised protein [Chlamydia trachomatis]